MTVLKNKTRESQGVAFVLFVDRASAHKAVRVLNNREMFGRTLKCSIAKDNGRAAEFIKRKVYKDKSFCYECGVCVFICPFSCLLINYASINQLVCPLQASGHLSYQCPNNALGDRQLPQKKKKKRKDFEYG